MQNNKSENQHNVYFCRHPLASSPHVNVTERMMRFPSESVLLRPLLR